MKEQLLLGLQEKKVTTFVRRDRHKNTRMYKNVAWICRWKIRTTKAQLKLNLVTTVKDNKKGFYKYLNNKGGTRRISILYRISSIIQRETFSNLLLHLDCMSPWGQMRSTEILRDLVEVIAKIFSVICQQF